MLCFDLCHKASSFFNSLSTGKSASGHGHSLADFFGRNHFPAPDPANHPYAGPQTGRQLLNPYQF
jgi:hypothetical protein